MCFMASQLCDFEQSIRAEESVGEDRFGRFLANTKWWGRGAGYTFPTALCSSQNHLHPLLPPPLFLVTSSSCFCIFFVLTVLWNVFSVLNV